MSQKSSDELRDTVQLKERADNRLIAKIETANFVYVMGVGLFGAIVAITLWVASIAHDKADVRRDLDYNRSAIGKLWKQVFNSDLP